MCSRFSSSSDVILDLRHIALHEKTKSLPGGMVHDNAEDRGDGQEVSVMWALPNLENVGHWRSPDRTPGSQAAIIRFLVRVKST